MVVSIHIVTNHDIDGLLKPVLDSLQAAGFIDNDKNILELHVFRAKKKNRKKDEDNIKVFIDNID